jgi:hypothetical protein
VWWNGWRATGAPQFVGWSGLTWQEAGPMQTEPTLVACMASMWRKSGPVPARPVPEQTLFDEVCSACCLSTVR